MRAETGEVQELMRRVQARLAPWRASPEWDDILQESYLKAWESYQRAKRTGMRSPMAVAVVAASRWGPATWLKKWYGRDNQRVHESLEEIVRLSEGEERAPTRWLPFLIDRGSGPEAEALSRLERAALWAWLRRRATPRQIQALVHFYLLGETPTQTGQHLGITPPAACAARTNALHRCRIDPQALPTFLRPATDYPRCPRGHYLAPENVSRVRNGSKGWKIRCRLCHNASLQACRAAKAERLAAAHPQKPQQGVQDDQELACGQRPTTKAVGLHLENSDDLS